MVKRKSIFLVTASAVDQPLNLIDFLTLCLWLIFSTTNIYVQQQTSLQAQSIHRYSPLQFGLNVKFLICLVYYLFLITIQQQIYVVF